MLNKNYKISFYDINETPPKVSVKVASSDQATFKDIDITTSLSATLENDFQDDILKTKLLKEAAKTVLNP